MLVRHAVTLFILISNIGHAQCDVDHFDHPGPLVHDSTGQVMMFDEMQGLISYNPDRPEIGYVRFAGQAGFHQSLILTPTCIKYEAWDLRSGALKDTIWMGTIPMELWERAAEWMHHGGWQQLPDSMACADCWDQGGIHIWVWNQKALSRCTLIPP